VEFLTQIIWIVVLASLFMPLVQRRLLEAARLRMLQRIEDERKSRAIALIHRQESMSLLGIPVFRFIDIDDSEDVLRAVRMTPDDMPLDVILHTPGGLVIAAEQIAMALCRHPAKVTVFIPHYALSGGTLIALAADEIVMDEDAVLGPLDPQLGEYPAASVLRAVARKNVNELDDRTLILADVAEKAVRQVRDFVECLLRKKVDEEKAARIAEALTDGRWTHDYPISFEKAKELGLPVTAGVPQTVHELMALYPQPAQRRPSVQYVPVPYRDRNGPPPPRPKT
jgi:ClpP class serine protease